MTTSPSSLEFHKDFHDDVLDVFVIGTVFTNEDNNDDIEHLKPTLESAELNSIYDFEKKIKVKGIQINVLRWAPKTKKSNPQKVPYISVKETF